MKTVKQSSKTAKTTKPAVRKTTVRAQAISTKPASVAKVTKPARAVSTTIQARVDVGFGNNLFIRGQGAGLNWEQGVPLKNVDSTTWQWTGVAKEKLTFKLLLNDAVWAQGTDIVVAPGQKVEITPNF